MLRRLALILGGAAIGAVCYAFTINASLGLGPLFVVQEGVTTHIDITIGQSVMVVGSTLCVFSMLMRQWPGFGTVTLPFIMGSMVDLALPHTPEFDGIVLRVVVVVVASWLMALSGALIIQSRIGAAAPDLVMLGLSRITGFSNRRVRNVMELSFIVIGFLIGGTVGIGTIITGLVIGPGLHFWIQRLHSEPVEQEHVVV